jgi:ribosome-dependent ATPase
LEEAFIAYIEDAIAQTTIHGASEKPSGKASAVAEPARAKRRQLPLWLGRTLAYARNETIQIMRDPIRLAFAFAGSALMMFVFGFGITTDVEHIRYASYDRDQSPESRTYLEQFRGTPTYFRRRPPIDSDSDAFKRLQSDDISFYLEIPPNFGRDLQRGRRPEVLANVDGANPFRAETVAGYVRGVNMTTAQDPGNDLPQPGVKKPRGTPFQDRYMYNPTFKSIYSIVPDVPAILLILIPAILMTVAIVREKELGAIINFYVTPTRKVEFLLGKQLPYVAIGMINFFILAFLALTLFRVPMKGSFLMLTLCTLLYVMVTTAIGMVTSTFTKTQVAAVFVTAILTLQPTVQYAGMLQPVSTLDGGARLFGLVWPTTYYMHASLGAYTKGIAPGLMIKDVVVLLCTYPILLGISVIGMRKQEK